MNTKAVAAIVVVTILLSGGAAAATVIIANSGDDLPEKFDQRDRGIVTPVKYQNPWGTCWSFGSTGAAETSVLTYLGMTAQQFREKEGYDLDFSEKHLAWFALNAVTEAETDSQVGEGYMLVRETDYHYIYDNGGRATMAASLYSTGVGPVLEGGLFRYMGENGTTALKFFEEDTLPDLPNTKSYLNYVAKDSFGDAAGYEHFLATVDNDVLDNLLDNYRTRGIPLDPSVDAASIKADTEEGFKTMATAFREYLIPVFTKSNQYSDMDNWVIPLGEPSQRNYTSGYTMINGNLLVPPCTVNGNNEWTGLSDERMELIKKELYAGHGMGMSYYYDKETLNTDTWAQFNSSNDRLGTTNHAIQLVGWDDTFSRDNFKDKPEMDGAWLCKNSWGSETEYDEDTGIGKTAWGIVNSEGLHTGYFWISYCDRSISKFISYEFGESPGDESFNAYVYDFLPSYRERTLNSEDVLLTANVFTIGDAKEKLESVSIKTGYYGSDVKVSVYRLNDGFADPTDGTLLWETRKTFDFEGFHRIIVDKDIEMTAGQKVSVVVEEKNSYYEGGKTMYIADYNFGFDYDKAFENPSNKAIYCVTKVNAGESYLLLNGEWQDWHASWEEFKTEDHEMIDNFRIKMFTVDVAA